jgi:hypothetical protein
MACIIGSTRETVTVVLGQLQKENFLRISRRRVIITDLDRLASEVNEPAPTMNLPALSATQYIPRFNSQ